MSGYFKYFPQTLYTFDKNTENPQLVTNILARSTFLREILENSAIWYEYQLKEGDTPEIIADKLYGDPQRHWIVLLFNQIQNPYYEFPLRDDELEAYITNKYGTDIATCQTTTHHIEQTVTKTVLYNNTPTDESSVTTIVDEYDIDFDTGQLTQRTVPVTIDSTLVVSTETVAIDSQVSVQIVTSATRVSNYNYELAQNQSRNTIRLLDRNYVTRIEDEFKKLMQNG